MNKDLKPLEALERIGNQKTKDTSFGDTIKTNCVKEYKTIEKHLKALEIIKEKQVDVGRIILIINTWFDDDFALHRYNDFLENDLDKWKLTKEEFDLLKEVLK